MRFTSNFSALYSMESIPYKLTTKMYSYFQIMYKVRKKPMKKTIRKIKLKRLEQAAGMSGEDL